MFRPNANLVSSSFQKLRSIAGNVCVLTFLFSTDIYAEDDSKREERNPKQRFELLLKRQTYQFVPYNYTSFSERTDPNSSVQTEHLQQNRKVLVPAVFSYENYEKNYRIETGYYEVELVNPNSNVIRTDVRGISAERFYYAPVARSEFEINGYKILSVTKDWNLYLGGGIRNINKYTYGYYLLDGAFQEYFYTYGPQASFQSRYRFYENITFAFGLDGFYTEGTRFFRNPIFSPSSITLTNGSAGTRGIYRGFEAEVSLQYQFHENMKFQIGYNQISSYFSYLHFDQINAKLDFSNPSIWTISNASKSGNYEILKGFFLGFSVLF